MGFDWNNGGLYDYEVISEHVDRASPSAQVVGHCTWADRLTIAQQLVGGLQNNNGSWDYNEPASYPYGLLDGIKCNSVDIKPLGDYDTSGNYNQAELTMGFGVYPVLTYDDSNPITIAQITSNASAEQLPLPNGKFQWPDGTVLSEDDWKPSKVFPSVELSVKVLYAAEPLLKDITDLLGTVNDSDFNLPNANGSDDTWAENTVLFLGVGVETVCNSEGYLCYQRDLKFAIRDNDGLGWNALFNTSTNQFEAITSTPDDSGNGGGKSPYEQGDFSTLFQIQS